jgi:tetratricopeptide (TPR) repeat protein
MSGIADSMRDGFLAGVVCCLLLGASTARGQSPATLRELQKLHDRMADPTQVLSAKDAKSATDRLTEWKLTPEKLSPEDRGRLWRIEVYVALAEGDAAGALEHAQALLAEFPDDSDSLQAAYLAACAAGDAKLGGDVLKKLSKTAKGDERRLISRRRRWIRGVGEKAPEIEIRTEDMTGFWTTRRGERVLVIDFWNVLVPPDASVVKALRQLYEEYCHSRYVEFVGVNADSENRVEQAKEFAKENGYVWKQRYEYSATRAPITHEAFGAGTPPWVVAIDIFGYVRAIGAADEPGFQYALRAAVAEAAGDYEPVMPRDRHGKQPTRSSESAEAKAGESQKPKEKAGELPSNAEAAAKLRLARTYLKTGKRTDALKLFKEIVRDYPGTFEAREAQEYLDSLSGP